MRNNGLISWFILIYYCKIILLVIIMKLDGKLTLRDLLILTLCSSEEKMIKGKGRLEKIIYVILNELLRREIIHTPPTKFIKNRISLVNHEIIKELITLKMEGVIDIRYRYIKLPGKTQSIAESIYILIEPAMCEEIKIDERVIDTIKEVVKVYEKMPLIDITKKIYASKIDNRLIEA